MESLNTFVPNVHFEQIPIKNLVSNQEYQRNLSQRHIKRTIANFDLYQINPVKVSRRNGINYVFNGQHTIEIVAAVSDSRETPVWCMVYDDLDYTLEADIFANQQKYVKTLTPFEIFNAHIEAGNTNQLMIKSLVESYGLKITTTRTHGGVCAVSCLERLYLKHGFPILDRTLRLVVGTWESDIISLSSNMLNGVARLIIAYEDDLKDDFFRDRVGSLSAREIARNAKERRAGSLGYAETMLLAYNKKTKFGLSSERLYSKETIETGVYQDVVSTDFALQPNHRTS
ncbi:hypothetical protein FACS189490_07110 [Clostridia bacterium]|nr:hypothetical protein FACS189490_07110 [Clostridia bacterium]